MGADSWGSYHLQGGTGKSAESKRWGRRVLRVRVWSPSRCDSQGVPLALLPPAPNSLKGSPLAPSSPRHRLPIVVQSAAHPLSGTGPPRDSACLFISSAPTPHILGDVPLTPGGLPGRRGEAEPQGELGPREPADRQTDWSVSDRPALGQGKALAKLAAAAAGAESASGPVPPPPLRESPYPVVSLLLPLSPTFANTLPLQYPCWSPSVPAF